MTLPKTIFAELSAMWLAGVAINVIATTMGCSPRTVTQRAKVLCLPSREKRQSKAPNTTADDGEVKMKCLCCGVDFFSIDRVRNRVCKHCKSGRWANA